MRNRTIGGFGLAMLALALAGCVTATPRESADELNQRALHASAACRAQPLTSFTERAVCLNRAALIAASVAPNPDLFQRALSARLEIAQKVDAKEMTPAQGAKAYRRVETELTTEAKQRATSGG